MTRQVVLTETEAKLIAELLEKASNEFSNHTCNDFDMSELGLTPAECNELHRLCTNPNEEPDTGPYIEDWILMNHFSRKLRGRSS